MNYNFVKVDKKTRGARADSIYIRIDCYNGIFFLGSKFYQDNNIKDFKFAHFFCDKARKTVAIKFLKDPEKDVYKIAVLENLRNARLMARNVLRCMDLKSKEKKSIKIIPEKIEDEKLGTLFLLKI